MKTTALGAFAFAAAVLLSGDGKAQTLFRDPLYDSPLYGGPAYRGNGQIYYQVPDNSIHRNRLYDSQLRNQDGDLYNCDSIGICTKSPW